MPLVFLGCPTHSGQLDAGTARSIYATATQREDVQILPMVNGKSLLASNCNWLWCNALNARLDGHDVKWFAMLHADIEPERWWLDKLLDEAEKYDADLMSAVIPIKDRRGITSTAIGGCRGGRHFGYGRLSQRQIWHEDFPETFDAAMCRNALAALPGDLAADVPDGAPLWANTGCMIVRADKPWGECPNDFEACREAVESL